MHAADREPLPVWGAAVRLHARGTSPLVNVADALADTDDQAGRRFGSVALDPGNSGTIDWVLTALARLAPGGRAAGSAGRIRPWERRRPGFRDLRPSCCP